MKHTSFHFLSKGLKIEGSRITTIYNSTEISDMLLNAAEGNKEESYLHYAVLIVSQRQANFLNGMLKTGFLLKVFSSPPPPVTLTLLTENYIMA